TAYGISGILGAITGIGIILGIFPPLGLVVLFASSLGSGIIAQLLEDSPIERYVKNCILRKGIDTKLLKEPFENVIELVKDREKHTKYGFEKWKDLQEATMNLMDIIFGYSVKTKLEHDWKYEGEENINKGLGERLGKIISESIIGKEAQTKKIESEFKFKMFMEDVSHLEYEIRIYPEGLKNSNYYFILQKSLGKDLEYKRNEKGIVTTTVSVTIPDEIFKKLQGYGDILMLTRLHYNNSLIFPEDDGNIPRFLAIKNTTSQNMGGNSSQNIMEIVNYLNLFGDKIRVGTLNEVLNEKTWIGEKK
ncbi:MAG: hypothetical protein N2053_04350, partial [Chitinispirillaceae bacterium]|nr:hypothetical protein [Chitinispirillaceae bacterium]